MTQVFLRNVHWTDCLFSETPPLGLGKLVKTEVDFRKKEALGMAPTQGSRKLGGKSKESGDRAQPHVTKPWSETEFSPTEPWECAVCTLFVII